MRILGINKGHDGGVALIKDGHLSWSIEAQCDSYPRHSRLNVHRMDVALRYLDVTPDVIAVPGWFDTIPGYHGCSNTDICHSCEEIDGHQLNWFMCSHERAHIMCSYGLSPFPQGCPCYALVWEGTIGCFFFIDERLTITPIDIPVRDPGHKYSFVFELGNPESPDDSQGDRMDVAGKLMALAGFQKQSMHRAEEDVLVQTLLNERDAPRAKANYQDSYFYNIGVEHHDFKSLARRFSDALFDRFYKVAKTKLTNGWPLLIAGGCGLNCEWNARWKDSGLFSDIFVPPVTEDSGVSIGAAIDAQRFHLHTAKVQWSVYSGEEFELDDAIPVEWDCYPLSYEDVAQFLREQKIIAWVQGRCEIGPRALGNRSILAAPFDISLRDRLNSIKFRESYRPIAPVSLEADFHRWFVGSTLDPYMLYSSTVVSSRLAAITHADQSARVQVVSFDRNSRLASLLEAFKAKTGFGVLCNTSLNFSSRGFINKLSDLIRFVRERKLDGAVVDTSFYKVRL